MFFRYSKVFIFLVSCFALTNSLAKQHLTLLLDWFVNPNHAPILIAKEKGYFAEQDLEVKIIAPTSPQDSLKLLLAEQADMAIDYGLSFISYQKEGLPLVKVGDLIGQPLNALVSKASIKTAADLKGKKIAFSTQVSQDVFLQKLLASAKLDLGDVELIQVNYNLSQALLTAKVDAALGMMRNFELIELTEFAFPYHAFYPEDYGVLPYSELIFVAKKEKDPRFDAFFKALAKAAIYVKKYPEESYQQAIRHYPELNNQLNYKSWLITAPLFDRH